MLETLNLDARLTKEAYRQRLPALQTRLLELQRSCHRARLASVVVFAGWGTSGRGPTIKKLTERLEPRAFTVHAVTPPRTYETHMPWMWRFWQRLPNWGEIALFQGSWYSEVIRGRAESTMTESRWLRCCRDIRFFEQALAADRYVFAKFFLHISREEQHRRLSEAAADPAEAWRLNEEDWAQHERHEGYLRAIEETLEGTEGAWAPWHLVEAHDKSWTRVRVLEQLIERLEDGLRRHHPGTEDRQKASQEPSAAKGPGGHA